VHDHDDRIDLFELATRLRLDLGRAILAVKAAELLDLVATPKQDVLVTPIGREFLAGDVNGRKRVFQKQLLRTPTFAFLVDRLRRTPDARLPADVVREELALHVPSEPTQELFDAIVTWGRYGEVLRFDADTDELFCDLDRDAAAVVAAPDDAAPH
jgi:NitT/TauT family transport system ATP-binding protein